VDLLSFLSSLLLSAEDLRRVAVAEMIVFSLGVVMISERLGEGKRCVER
jgi:hypothetical protein